MTDPSQYFRGRTVQEQMNEVIGYVDVRSAEVATDAIAADVAQVHQDMLDADADATAAAASAAAAAGTLANAVKKTGEASQSIDGDIDLNDDLKVDGDATVGGALSVAGAVTVPTPANNTEAANKKYVDDGDALKLNISDINTYGYGLTGNQSGTGQKINNGGQIGWNSVTPSGWVNKQPNADVTQTPSGSIFGMLPCLVDNNGILLGGIRIQTSTSNKVLFVLVTTAADGTTLRSKTLAVYNRANDVWE